MSSPRPPAPVVITPSAHEAAAISHEKLAVAVGQNEERVKGLGEDLHDLNKRLGGVESEMRRGFNDVAAQISLVANEFRSQNAALALETTRMAAPKGVQWPMVAVFCSVAFAMAAWASSYFGKDIQGLARENQQASERLTVLSNRQFQESLTAAKNSGEQERDAHWIEKQHERLEAEIDKLRARREASAP